MFGFDCGFTLSSRAMLDIVIADSPEEGWNPQTPCASAMETQASQICKADRASAMH